MSSVLGFRLPLPEIELRALGGPRRLGSRAHCSPVAGEPLAQFERATLIPLDTLS